MNFIVGASLIAQPMSESVSQELTPLNLQSLAALAASRVGAAQSVSRRAGECVDVGEQFVPALRDLDGSFIAKQIAQRLPDDGEEGDEQLARRA